MNSDAMTSDARARARALDPERSYIVQAPAGSGKTELLTQRFLRLLAVVEQPEQILAITFTRKAAAEMRSRIFLAMQSADGPAPESPHKRTTWELGRTVRNADVRRGWRLTEHPARLRIQTIDALNATLARRLPVLAGTGAALEPTDDPRALYEFAVLRLLERLGDGSVASASLEALIVHLGNRVDLVVDLLCELLAKRDQWLHPLMNARQRNDLRESLERTLVAVIDHYIEQLCDAVRDEQRRELWELTTYAAENLLADAALADARRTILEAALRPGLQPGASSRHFDAWLAIVDVFFRHGQPLRAVNVKQGFPRTNPAMKARMLTTLVRLSADGALCQRLAGLRHLPQPVYSHDQWRILQALLEVLPVAVAELQVAFQSQGKADYIEAALRALRALGTNEEPTNLALALDYRLQHLLVDELQDTSFAQLDLLERLTAGWSEGDGRTLFCVGDPMQSIYRFRQAEVGLFLELQRRGLPNVRLEPLTLTANFRSARPVVTWVNQVFPAVLAAQDDPEQGAVAYSASVAAVESEEGGVTIHAAIDVDDGAEARRVTTIVRDALKRDADGTIAVLVTARSHVGSIARELTAAGIDFQAVEIEPLRERPIVQDLIALTRALLHLGDRTAWLAVLRAPWCGLLLADLHAMVGEDRRSTINELLTKASQENAAISAEGRERLARVHAILQQALRERGRWHLRDWVERTWNGLGGPATLTRAEDLQDADAYLQRLEEIEITGDLEDVARLEEQLDRLFATPRSESTARVEVMTIHKAKGLEFDTVILPALHRWLRGDERELLRWTRIAGPQGGIVFAPIRAEGQDPDPVYRWIELLERERTARERGRLLYVAATRARRYLHLLGTAQTREDDAGVRLLEPRSGSMLRMLWDEIGPAFEKLATTRRMRPRTERQQVETPPLRRLPTSWQLPAADTALRITPMQVLDGTLTRPEFDWVTHTSRHVGTVVHRELERMVRAGPATHQPSRARRVADSQLALFDEFDAQPTDRPGRQPLPAKVPATAKPRIVAELMELGVPPDRCDVAAARVLSAIEMTLADAHGRWLLGLTDEIRDAESEVALSGVFGGQIVEGVIDRTFVDREGVRWVVDFKTSTHEGGALDAFLAAEVERYRPQLARYAQLMRAFKPGQRVKAALYFPLLRQWREVAL